MNHLALFNGIGGFQLAAEWCGWNNIAHVEIDDFCNKVVAQHFPNSVCHTDIKDFDGKQYAGSVDIISGGFPCQPYSVAGKRLGKEDDRALWPEMRRVIEEVGPDWVVGENVAGIVSMGLEHYVSDLENTGGGMMSSVSLFQLVPSAHPTEEIGFGLWQTPTRCDYKGVTVSEKFQQRNKQFAELTEGRNITGTIYPNPITYEAVMGYPIGHTDLKHSVTP